MGPAEPKSPVPVIRVEVAFSAAARHTELSSLILPLGSCVKDALLGSGLLAQAQQPGVSVGIWGRKTTLGHVLRDRDRVEICRGLIVDPKEARRVRYRAHGEKLPKGIHRPKSKPLTEEPSD